MQLVAVENLYMEMGIDYADVVCIGLSKLSSYDGEYVVLPVSFLLYGYRDELNITMFSPKIIPVFLELSVMGGNISEEEIVYLRRFEPIGCRDYYTVKWFRERNVCAYMNGCLTAMIPNISSGMGRRLFGGSSSEVLFLHTEKFAGWRSNQELGIV